MNDRLHSNRWAAVRFCLLLVCGIVASMHGYAQTEEAHPELVVTLEDGSNYMRINARRDTIPAEWFCAGYDFQMFTDTTCVTEYTFTGCKRNGVRVPLEHWKNGRAVNFAAELLAYNSRSAEMTLNGGDTLSFYRELSWMDPRFNRQLLNNYRSNDTLTYVVELVNSADDTRLALLDSIGIMPCPTLGTPTIHGTRPIMAHVFWIAPSAYSGVKAFIRVRPIAMGTGDYFFTRKEVMSVGLWRRLQDPYWANYLSQWGAYQKSIPWRSGTIAAASATARLAVRPSGAARDEVTIDFNAAPNGGPVTVVIYDMSGNVLFTPFARTESSGNYSVVHRFSASGAYVVALLHEGNVVRTEKITITR